MLLLRSKLPNNQLKVDDGSGDFCNSCWLVMPLSINQDAQRGKGRKIKRKRWRIGLKWKGKAFFLILSFSLHLASLKFQIPRPCLGSNL
jgi:hypothetical protein